jgi:hypothetical protein
MRGAGTGAVRRRTNQTLEMTTTSIERPRRRVDAMLFASIVVLLVPVVLGATHVPSMFAAGVAFERGQRAEARGDFRVAAHEYSNAARQLPASTLAIARKAIAAFHAGQFQIATDAIEALAGRKMPPELAREVNDVIEQLNNWMK